MEYIEEKPVESKKLSRKAKIVLAASIVSASALVIGVTYAILIDKVFLDYDNVSLYHFSYDTDDPNHEVTIDSVVSSSKIPSILRIPNKLNGYPVTGIGDNAFSHLDDIEQIIFPSTIKTIGKEAFEYCTNLKTLNFPDALVNVGTDAFIGTKWLEEQGDGEVMAGKFLYTYNGMLPEDSIIVKSEDSPEYSKHTGKVINLGNYSDISNGVFKDQENLVYAEIPDSYSEVHTELFENCINLEKVVLPENIKVISDFAFHDCISLSDINIPNSIMQIGSYAFYNTDLQGELKLPTSIDDIGEYAFGYNTSLTTVTFPAQRADGGLDKIPSGMFSECESLVTINLPAEEYSPATSHISSIGSFAFDGTALTNFAVPYNVSTIQDGAFEGATHLEKIEVYNNLTNTKLVVRNIDDDGNFYWEASQVVGQGLISIGSRVFNEATAFKGLVLVDEASNKTSANEVSLPVTLKQLGPRNDNSYVFAKTSIETLNLVKDLSHVTSGVTYENIAYIAPYLCSDDVNLTTVNVKENANLTEIMASAFENCTHLVSIELPDGLKTVGAAAFAGCTALNNIDLSKAEINGIAARLFENCTSLVEYNVNVKVATIQHSAFKGAISLKKVAFPEGSKLSVIMEDAFNGCVALDDIALPGTIANIGKRAFEGTTSLKQINLGTAITSVGEASFKNSGLTSISLPRGIKVLNISVFEGCADLASITLNCDTLVTMGNNALKDSGITVSTGAIYVPASLVDTYKADAKWSAYAERIQAIPAE